MGALELVGWTFSALVQLVSSWMCGWVLELLAGVGVTSVCLLLAIDELSSTCPAWTGSLVFLTMVMGNWQFTKYQFLHLPVPGFGWYGAAMAPR